MNINTHRNHFILFSIPFVFSVLFWIWVSKEIFFRHAFIFLYILILSVVIPNNTKQFAHFDSLQEWKHFKIFYFLLATDNYASCLCVERSARAHRLVFLNFLFVHIIKYRNVGIVLHCVSMAFDFQMDVNRCKWSDFKRFSQKSTRKTAAMKSNTTFRM